MNATIERPPREWRLKLVVFDQWFHTTADTPDKCAPETLGQVGQAVIEAVESP